METLVGYAPKVTVFEYNKLSACKFWLNYMLPNKKRVRRPCSNQKKEAAKLARIKQGQLANGKFDDYDRKKLGGFLNINQRLTISEAKVLYLELTSDKKGKRSFRNDKSLIKNSFAYFESQGLVYLDEISPLDCARLISSLNAKGLSKSSAKNYRTAVSKVFNKLKKMKLAALDNPMTDVELPKKGKLTRDRIPSVKEIESILCSLGTKVNFSPNDSPTDKIIPFALFTGARIGEVFHAEWDDFDLETGYWFIRNKPNCPGVEGIGWSPKWEKERTIKLFPEALSILLSMPKVGSIGTVRNETGEKIPVSARFVFPKQQVRVLKSCPMFVKHGYYQCFKCKEFVDRTLCGHRQVSYSRCDSIKKSWATILRKAGVEDLHLHDLRRFFNRVILQERLGFTPEEAGCYIGNSREVNIEHYSPISADTLSKKIRNRSFSEVVSSNIGLLN